MATSARLTSKGIRLESQRLFLAARPGWYPDGWGFAVLRSKNVGFWVDFFKSDEGKTGPTSLSPKNRFGGLGSFRVVEIGWTNFY